MTIKTPEPIKPLPPAPNPADRSTFNTRAYPWSEALGPWTEEANALAADTNENAQHAHDKAAAAEQSALDAQQAEGVATGAANTATAAADTAVSARNDAQQAEQTASSASLTAVEAREKAQQWATSTSVIEGGLKGARGYAQDAAQSAQEAADVITGSVGAAIHGADDKALPADEDELGITDSAAGWALRKLKWSELKDSVWAAFKSLVTGPNAKGKLGLGTAATRDVTTNSTDTTAGRVLKVGDFGVGGNNPVGIGFDANDLLPGQRRSWSEAFTEADVVNVNLPALGGSPASPRSWHVECVGSAPTRSVQYATEVYGIGTTKGRTFIRVKHDAIWYPWEEVHTTGNIRQTTGTSTEFPMSQKAVSDALENSGTYPASGASYTYQDGLVTKITQDGRDTLITYNADKTVNTITYPTGRVETYTYIDGVLTGMTATGG